MSDIDVNTWFPPNDFTIWREFEDDWGIFAGVAKLRLSGALKYLPVARRTGVVPFRFSPVD